MKFSTGNSLNLENSNPSLQHPTLSDLLESFEKHSELFEKFTVLWHEQYLLFLKDSMKLSQESQNSKIQENDLILISDEGKSRPFYQMGRAVKLLTGEDDAVRFVEVLRRIGLREFMPFLTFILLN